MKKTIILFYLLLCLLPVSQAQVSINTTNPNGVFYIDGAGDNGTTSANRFKNDVMVDGNGSLIMGYSSLPVTAKAKVDITSDAAYGALRMTDGGEGAGMVMLGDINGYAKWGMLKGSGGYKLSVSSPTAVMNTNVNYTVSYTTGLSYISITETATYIVMVRMAAIANSTPAGRTSGYFYLCKNGINTTTNLIDTVESYVGCINGQRFSIYTLLRGINLTAGDKLYLLMRPMTGTWTLDTSLTQVFFYRV